jgi:peptide chain release factor 2
MAEIPGFIKRHRDAAGIPGLQSKLQDLARELELAELEFLSLDPEAGAAIGAFVCVAPAGAPNEPPCDEWADTLLGMYAAWATDRGYESEAVHAPGAHQRVLLIRGPGIGRMLLGECGIHRRLLPPDQSRNARHSRAKAKLARVKVLPIPTEGNVSSRILGSDEVTIAQVPGSAVGGRRRVRAVHEPSGVEVEVVSEDPVECARLLLAALIFAEELPVFGPIDEVARVYGSLPSPYVRDPRTGLRHRRLEDVLAGDLNDFLLAYLTSRCSAASPPAVPAVIALPLPT